MIPEIGLVVAAYVLTRCLELRGRTTATPLTRAMCVVTIILATVVALDLIARGLEVK